MPQTVPPSQTPPPGGQTLPPRPTGALTHAGRVRRANEDGVFAAPARGLWAVADGMGGHLGGAEAAAEVTGALEDLAAALPRGTGLGPALDAMAAAIGEAGGRIAARAAAIPGAVIGATVVALAIRGTEWGCLWAGDSRAYRLRGGRLDQLTRDHSEANELLDAGVISAEEARTWPRANVVTRAVGVAAEVALDRATGRLAEAFLPVLDAAEAAYLRHPDEIGPLLNQMLAELKKLGLEHLDLENQPFDPEVAEAVAHEPGGGGEPVVAEVLRSGYTWKGRVLRAAMVKTKD